jgi:predicted DNA-binding protein (UPF0251 family)
MSMAAAATTASISATTTNFPCRRSAPASRTISNCATSNARWRCCHPDQREVLLLVGLEELSYAEVARALNIPQGTVMSRLSRARARLKAMLAGEAATILKVVSHMNTPISEDDLHAYADGQLDAARLTQVEAGSPPTPSSARKPKSGVRRAAGLAPRLRPVCSANRCRRACCRPPMRRAGSMRASWRRWPGSCSGSSPCYVLRARNSSLTLRPLAVASLPRQAAVAHAVFVPEVRHPVEVGAEQEAHLADIENRTFDEIQVGDSATLVRTSPEDIQLFAIMSGDVNPAHVDPEYAKSSHVPRGDRPRHVGRRADLHRARHPVPRPRHHLRRPDAALLAPGRASATPSP